MEENIQAAVNTNVQLNETKALLTSNQSRLTSAESKIVNLETKVKQLKEIVNHREQLARSLCVRIVNLPVAEDEINGPDPAAATAKLAYERVIRPLLTAAKTKSKISSVPNLPTAVTKAYRLAKPSLIAAAAHHGSPCLLQLQVHPLHHEEGGHAPPV
jgi:hypothetical protein